MLVTEETEVPYLDLWFLTHTFPSPTFLVSLLTSIYSVSYWNRALFGVRSTGLGMVFEDLVIFLRQELGFLVLDIPPLSVESNGNLNIVFPVFSHLGYMAGIFPFPETFEIAIFDHVRDLGMIGYDI